MKVYVEFQRQVRACINFHFTFFLLNHVNTKEYQFIMKRTFCTQATQFDTRMLRLERTQHLLACPVGFCTSTPDHKLVMQYLKNEV